MNLIPTQRFFNSFIDDIEHQWGKVIDNFFQPANLGDLKHKLKSSAFPRIDEFTINDKYVVQATVPGVNPDDLLVEVINDENNANKRYLRLSGQMSKEYQYDEASWKHKELHRRAFCRVVDLPEGVEGDPEASIKDGVVTLSWPMPKAIEKPSGVKKIALKRE